MGFEYSDLWLSRTWYLSYQSALAEWRNQVGLNKDTVERQTYEANAAKAGSMRKMLESVSARLRQQMRQLTDPEVSIRLAELHGGTDWKIDLLLHELPLANSEAVQQGLNRCLGMTEGLIQNMTDSASGLMEREKQALHDVLERCRGDMERFRDELVMIEEAKR
jgi:hypothetical protein